VVAAATGAPGAAGTAAAEDGAAAATGEAAGAGAGFPIVVVVVHPATNIAMQANTSRITKYFLEFITHTGCGEKKRIMVQSGAPNPQWSGRTAQQ
jgi:hypothetical protein